MSNDPRNRAPTEDPPYKVYRSSDEDGPKRTGPQERPYKLYRSVPKGLRARLRGEEEIVEPRRGRDDELGDGRRGGGPGGGGSGGDGSGGDGGRGPGRRGFGVPKVPWIRRRWTVRRVLKYVVLFIVGWLLLSLVLFLVSA